MRAVRARRRALRIGSVRAASTDCHHDHRLKRRDAEAMSLKVTASMVPLQIRHLGVRCQEAARHGGGAGEIRTREPGTPVFPMRTPETAHVETCLPFNCNST